MSREIGVTSYVLGNLFSSVMLFVSFENCHLEKEYWNEENMDYYHTAIF